MLRLEVVVVNWNRLQETRDCIRRLLAWRDPEPRLRVVDNGSVDGSAEALAREFPQIELLASPVNLGYGGGTNLALRSLAADYALLLNNDAKIEEAGVRRLLELLENRAEVAVAGPVIVERSGTGELVKAGGRDISIHAATHLELERIPPGRIVDGVLEVDYVSGTAAIVRASAIAEIGLLDERYFFAGEVADLCQRARRRGYSSVIGTAARASHEPDRAGGLRETLYPYFILRNRFLYVRKFRGAGVLALFPYWTARGLFGALRALVNGHGRKAQALLLGLLHGWLGRFGAAPARLQRWNQPK